MQVDDARQRIATLALEIDEDCPILSIALLLVLRMSRFDRACQMRLMTAGSAAVEAIEECLKVG